jgi:hypothetical protein
MIDIYLEKHLVIKSHCMTYVLVKDKYNDSNVKNHNKEGIMFTMYVMSVLISGQRQKVNISMGFCVDMIAIIFINITVTKGIIAYYYSVKSLN